MAKIVELVEIVPTCHTASLNEDYLPAGGEGPAGQRQGARLPGGELSKKIDGMCTSSSIPSSATGSSRIKLGEIGRAQARVHSRCVALAAAGVLSARSGMQAPAEQEGEKKLIDLKSDLMGPIAPGDSVVFLVGNFAAQHNGAVITCDSAVRYSDMRIEFFGNVLINKNTTYIYGDRAEVRRRSVNEARVYSDIIKVVDGDATLYTYKFLFNTKSNIGEFDNGGVMLNRENCSNRSADSITPIRRN
ncbi:MAG: OstA-like protein [Alistipes shahii]